jgi:TatD DNase family protein
MRLCDAHNHLQDPRLRDRLSEIVSASKEAGVVQMVVNGSCESDWPDVAALARRFPDLVIPSFGYHPWHLRERTDRWQSALQRFLDDTPGAVIGEIGLDRWILEQTPEVRRRSAAAFADSEPASLPEQEEVFLWQWKLAAERNLAASIHCLRAFGHLEELLRGSRGPARGFLIHSYGGPAEMVPSFAQLGARFGFPGCFADPRRHRKLEAFRRVPVDRLLAETDAPDQALPPGMDLHSLRPGDGETTLNHPANLLVSYRALSELRNIEGAQLAAQIEKTFQVLFGRQ